MKSLKRLGVLVREATAFWGVIIGSMIICERISFPAAVGTIIET